MAMPHIRTRNLTEANVRILSQRLPKELAQMMSTAEDNFTVEKINTVFYRNGQPVPDGEGDPMIEIHWFDRGHEIKAGAAKKTTELVYELTQAQYIAVVFFDLPKTDYFENGKHF